MNTNIDARIEKLTSLYTTLKNNLYILDKVNIEERESEAVKDTVYQIIGVALDLNELREKKYQLELEEINNRPTNSIYENQQKIEEIIKLNNRRQAELEALPELGNRSSTDIERLQNDVERLQNINSNLTRREKLKTENSNAESKINELENMTDDFSLLKNDLEQQLSVAINNTITQYNLEDADKELIDEDVNIAQMSLNASQLPSKITASERQSLTPTERKSLQMLASEELNARQELYLAREKQIILSMKNIFEQKNDTIQFDVEKRLLILNEIDEIRKMRIDLGLPKLEELTDNGSLVHLENLLRSQSAKFYEFRDRNTLLKLYRNRIDKNNAEIENIETILNGLGISSLETQVEKVKSFTPIVEAKEDVMSTPVTDKRVKLYYDQDNNSIHIGVFENNELIESLPTDYQFQDRKSVIGALKQTQLDPRFADCILDFRFPKEYQTQPVVVTEKNPEVENTEEKGIALANPKEIVLSGNTEEKGIALANPKEIVLSGNTEEKGISLANPKVIVLSEDEYEVKDGKEKPKQQTASKKNDRIFTDEERIEKGYEYLTVGNANNLHKINNNEIKIEALKKEKSNKGEAPLKKVIVEKVATIPDKVKKFFINNKKKIAAVLTTLAIGVGMSKTISAPETKVTKTPVTPATTASQMNNNYEVDDDYQDVLADVDEVDFGGPTKPVPTVAPLETAHLEEPRKEKKSEVTNEQAPKQSFVNNTEHNEDNNIKEDRDVTSSIIEEPSAPLPTPSSSSIEEEVVRPTEPAKEPEVVKPTESQTPTPEESKAPQVDTPDVKGNPSTIRLLDSNGNMVERSADEYFGLLSQDYANENTVEHGRSR